MTRCVSPDQPRVAEFFAGIGLVRMALEQAGFRVVFANDVSAAKRQLYAGNFDASDYVLGDVRDLAGADVPDVDVATASFPCTDVSLAGGRAGLAGSQSGMFWEFARLLEQMGDRRPPAILLENVAGLSSSGGGGDFRAAILRLNDLGYWCDPFVVDARWFVPQSRPRLFIVGSLAPLLAAPRLLVHPSPGAPPSSMRPAWLGRFLARNPDLRLHTLPLAPPPLTSATLANVVERLPPDDQRWWGASRMEAFGSSLSATNTARVERLKMSTHVTWRTAYRRTRNGSPVWEVRADPISGCLRTARGGSSKQAVVEAGDGTVRVRWMTPREYAHLQGAPNYHFGGARPLQVLFGFGDAVCVPAVAWIAREYLLPLARGELRRPDEPSAAFDGGWSARFGCGQSATPPTR